MEKRGVVKIADHVIAIIASIAAHDIEGVVLGSKQGLYEGIARRVTGKGTANGVSVSLGEEGTAIEMRVYIRYGTEITQVCRSLQQKVKEVVEFITGVHVREVNVHVDGIELG